MSAGACDGDDRVTWLASYPKSGNTWLRLMIAHALGGEDHDLLQGMPGHAADRAAFDDTTLLPSTYLDIEAIEALRPAVHARGRPDLAQPAFVKTHDGWLRNASGTPILGGAAAARGAILIVRDPRAVAPSFAVHSAITIDRAIETMGRELAADGRQRKRDVMQLPQRIPDWSAFQQGWLDQDEIPVHLVRYEDMSADPAGTLMAVFEAAGRPLARDRADAAARTTRFERLAEAEAREGFRERRNGRFFRRGRTDGWREELSPEQIARIEARHAPMMARLGYAPA